MTLRKGDKGGKVMMLQSALMGRGILLPKYGLDGIFGRETEQAVKQAQQKLGITISGVADPMTLELLGVIKRASTSGKLVDPTKDNSMFRNLGVGHVLLAAIAIVGAGIAIKKAKRK